MSKKILKLLRNETDEITTSVNEKISWAMGSIAIFVFILGFIWFVFTIFSDPLKNYEWSPDANNLEIFVGIVGFIFSVAIFATALRSEKATERLRLFLSRSWSGTQSDYGAGLNNSSNEAKQQIVRHLDDLERAFRVPTGTPLDEVFMMVSSMAYGIENSPAELARFVNIFDFVIKHEASSLGAGREVNFAIWPKLEHQIIWGADRQSLQQEAANRKMGRFTPSFKHLVKDKSWASKTPFWCETRNEMFKNIEQLKRIGLVLEYCEQNDKKIKLEINEIEKWSGRAFFCRYGDSECFTLYIATTPINSSTLSASHWTTVGFSSNNLMSFNHFKQLYTTCEIARHSHNEPTASKGNADLDVATQNSDRVVRVTRQFLSRPFAMIGEYFLLPARWETWTEDSQEFGNFFQRLADFRTLNS